jgi:hypothetical protein
MKILVWIDLPALTTNDVTRTPILGTIVATDFQDMVDSYQALEPESSLKSATILNITYSD